jgi:hypothetical protein
MFMNRAEATELLRAAWPLIVDESRAVLGGELHYQAIVYWALRQAGVPRTQIGMNVKQWIDEPVSELFRTWDARKNVNFQGGFEPIPDVVLFAPEIAGNWQRRNRVNTLKHMLIAIEVKASERAKSRLSQREIERDIHKLAAHREELCNLGSDMLPVMMVIDVATDASERMLPTVVERCADIAREFGVAWMYVSPDTQDCQLEVEQPVTAAERTRLATG